MDDKSIMKEEENPSFEEKIEKEYKEAIINGFKGTKEEYYALRDYT